MQNLIEQFYEEFKGVGAKAIVRNGQVNDAFEIVVLKILYGRLLDLTFDKEHIEELEKYITTPPDSGIDIFVQKEEGDEAFFDIIQVKNKSLTESELRDAITTMERTISDFCKSPLNVSSESCREMLSKSSLDTNCKKNCQYFVVHTGDLREFNGIKDNEHIINLIDLQILAKSKRDKVEDDSLSLAGKDSYMQFGNPKDDQSAVICNINGFDLAVLNNKYYSTEIGRNILFGHNLRESLNPKSSKSYKGMLETIKKCPDNFWYYNNGITIVAEEVKPKTDGEGKTSIRLKRFSIVNGAQTTSSLGLILQEATRNRDVELENSLKKAFVIARILKVNNPDTENAVAIFNNTQNPITSRDMVANNTEQRLLYEKLMDVSYPQIFMEIRRGSKIPQSFNRAFVHRKTTNEGLAQLAYAGFFLQPFTAKDKKAALFNNDISQNLFTMNEIYHKVFNYDEVDDSACGILFRKTKNEIDELLFVQELYKEGKTYLKKKIQERLDGERVQYDSADSDQKIAIQTRIERDTGMLETIGVCMFYFVTTYYEFSAQYGNPWVAMRYDFEKFYQDKMYRKELVENIADFFLVKTVQFLLSTAKENGKSGNINNWVRSAMCQTKYLDALRSAIGFDMNLSSQYEELMKKYKVVPV